MEGRTEELATIRAFLQRDAGSLFVCGSPGTGKTLSVSIAFHEIDEEDEDDHHHQVEGKAFVNAMSCVNPRAVFVSVLHGVLEDLEKKKAKKVKRQKVEVVDERDVEGARRRLEGMFLSGSGGEKEGRFLVVLDEIDHLVSENQEVLETLFGWAMNQESSLLLIGIANRVDLHQKYLPLISKQLSLKEVPQALVFQPYKDTELAQILKKKISTELNVPIEKGEDASQNCLDDIISSDAIAFCAKKVAAKSGDCRRALEICHLALRSVGVAGSTDQEKDEAKKKTRVTLPQILNVMKTSEPQIANAIQNLPQQAMYALIATIRASRGGGPPLTLKTVFSAYSSMARQWDLPKVELSDFSQTVFPQLAENGLITTTEPKKKTEFGTRITSIKVRDEDLRLAFSDNVQMRNLLGLPL